jgi:hypothetical protein
MVHFSITRVLAQQVVEFSLRLKDQDSNTAKVIGIKGSALPPVYVKEQTISVKAGAKSEEGITILSRFDRMKIEGVEPVGDDFECTVSPLSPTESKLAIIPKQGWRGSSMVVNVKLSGGKEDFIFVPIVYRDSVDFITRELVFEKGDGEKEICCRVIVLIGEENADPQLWKIKASTDDHELAGMKVVKVFERAKRVLVLTISGESEKLPSDGNFKVSFSCASGNWERILPARIERKNNE